MVHSLRNNTGTIIEFDPSSVWVEITAYDSQGRQLFMESKPVGAARRDWSAYLQEGFTRV